MVKAHECSIYYLTKLNNGILASCSQDKSIKLFNIERNNYKILRTLNYHEREEFKIIELKNNNLVSCSNDKSIIFFTKDKSSYKKHYKLSTNGTCNSLIQTKDNEICYSEYNNNYNICLFDYNQKQIKILLPNINCNTYTFRTFNMITKSLLIVGCSNKIFIINISKYNLVREIDIPNSNIFGFCRINKNIFLL